jgi:hypothetical protein
VLVSSDLFENWVKALPASQQGVTLYGERPGARAAGLKALKGLLAVLSTWQLTDRLIL